MSNTNTGGPAFPHAVEYKGAGCAGIVPHGGMTLRDYFAAKAMQSVLETFRNTPYDSAAKYAYQMADAMLEARQV